MRAALVLLLLVAGFFSGCVDEKNGTGPLANASDVAAPGTVASTAITSEDQAEAPTWPVGTAFGHHVFFGADDGEGQHYNTIVIRDEGDSFFLASDDETAARDEATIDIPILGPISKADLRMTGLGGEWDFFRFPMHDGLTWESTFSVNVPGFSASWDVTHVARFNPAIVTPHGPRPGWDIEAKTADGETLLFYDYVPDLGWYAHLFVYDLMTEEKDDFVFHVMSMGRTQGWTGSYYVFDAKTMLEIFNGVAAIDDVPPGVPPEPFADPKPVATFTMDEGATLLNGFVVAFAFAGAHEVLLVDPNGKHHEFQALGTPEGEAGGSVDLPAIAGEWKLVSVGAAVVWFEIAYLWQLTAAHGEL